MRKVFILNLITFIAAFLLFQIELIISKILLPQYGGSYLVWGACVVFFQAALFLGYLYSHIISRKIGIKKYLPLHLVLLLLPLLFFPGRPLAQAGFPGWDIPLVFSVFIRLCLTIGPVFFVLSTISVILQVWLADSALPEAGNPYPLYALSNLGSFAALLSYPFFFELFFDLDQQTAIWRAAYLALVALNILAFFRVKAAVPWREGRLWSTGNIRRMDLARWFLFSAAGVIMFLSVTNILTYEIAPIPLLWVIPLCIYLLSFTLNFKQRPWCPDWISGKFYLTLSWSLVIFFLTLKRVFPFSLAAVFFCLLLFNLCMFCQRNLYQAKPVDPRQLPLFYLIISFGGLIGGSLSTWLMPLVSVSLLEYPLGLLIVTLAYALGGRRELQGLKNMRFIVYSYAAFILWPMLFSSYNVFGIVFLFLFLQWCYCRLADKRALLFAAVLLVFTSTPVLEQFWMQENIVFRLRNYYGTYKVSDAGGKLLLSHGTTLHGAQFLDEKKKNTPLLYYHPKTPIGGLLGSDKLSFGKIGAIGLGAGSIAAYGRPGTEFDFFEIDPDVYPVAREMFSYIARSPSRINFIFGDARIKLKESKGIYDILIIDAFSGDSIPTHLLTVEAIQEYREHLSEGGIILFHISNRYLELAPVLYSNAVYLNAYPCYKANAAKASELLSASSWFILTWDIEVLKRLVLEFKWKNVFPPRRGFRLLRPWTDKYSNLVLVMRSRDFINSIRYLQPFYW